MPAKFWLATFGDLGLEVEFFATEAEYNAAVAKAEKDHGNGEFDSYTHGDVPAAIPATR
jgi:hypothetical protein